MTEQTHKILLLGDQAVALGAIHAGLSGVYAYPGTPSTEITEYIQDNTLARERNIFCRWWCRNEKTAMESALGMSYMGKRALVCMKHVGLNVAADAFVNSAITGVNGGLVVLVADAPSMHSSQNEQDSRFYGEICPHADIGTVFSTRGLRHDGLCLQLVRRIKTSHTHAGYHPHGPLTRCRKNGIGTRAQRDKQQRRSVQFHFIAGERPPTLCRIGKPTNTARKLIGRVSIQPICRSRKNGKTGYLWPAESAGTM